MRAPRSSRLLLAAALLGGVVAAQVETVLCDFEPGADEPFAVVGRARPERDPTRVTSGVAALRVTGSPAESRPGLRIPGTLLRRRGAARHLAVDVFNPESRPVPLVVRVEGEGRASHRRDVLLAPGRNRIETDLERLDTDRGGRVDPARIVLVSYAVEDGGAAADLVFDRVRLVDPTRAAPDPDAEARRRVARFEALHAAETVPDVRDGLVAALADADVDERIGALDRRVLAHEDEPRGVDAALRVLAGTRRPTAVAAAIDLARRSAGRRRLRWTEAAARMDAPAAAAFVEELAATGAGPETVVALLARKERRDPALLPWCDASLGGGWQVRVARVAALAAFDLDASFRPLTAFLADDHGRVRADAEAALAALTGTDLGDRPEPWLAWRRATASRPLREGGERRAYATYYGLPLSPGASTFVIDVSGSMRAPLVGGAAAYAARMRRVEGVKAPTRLDLAREELIAAIDALPPRATFRIVVFSSAPRTWEPAGTEATKEAKARARRFVSKLEADGATDLHGALELAFDPAATPAERLKTSCDTIYLLTDGEPTAGRVLDPEGVAAAVRDWNRGRAVRVHAVGLGEADCSLLRDLARATDGRFVDLAK